MLLALTVLAVVALLLPASAAATAQKRGALKGQTALITGASSGIGRAVALHLATYGGANVVVTARREAALASLVDEITTAGGRALAVKCDVRSADDMRAAFAAAVAEFGAVQHVLANAGVMPKAAADDWDAATRTFDVNYFGVRRTLHESLKEFERHKRRPATFVAVSSIGGSYNRFVSSIGASVAGEAAFTVHDYHASKAAVDALVRIGPHVAKQYDGVRLFGLTPSVYHSEMIADTAAHLSLPDQHAVSGFNQLYPGSAGDPRHLGRVVGAMFAADCPLEPGASVVCDNDVCYPLHELTKSLQSNEPHQVSLAALLDTDLQPRPFTTEQHEAHRAELLARVERERARAADASTTDKTEL